MIPTSETTTTDAPAHEKGELPLCRYCARPFSPKKARQRFCRPDHKKAFEQVMIDLIKEIRGPLWAAAEKLAEARR